MPDTLHLTTVEIMEVFMFVSFNLKIKMLRVINYEILILVKLGQIIILKKENKRQNLSILTKCHFGKVRL